MSKSVFLRVPGLPVVVLDVLPDQNDVFSQINHHVQDVLHLSDYWIDYGESEFRIRLRLRGGKGGFGSNLRAQGNKMSSKKRAGGYEACRDLTGRRIRTINQTNLITEYLKKKPELERKREAAIREKMLKAIEAPDKRPIFKDVEYLRTANEAVDSVEAAVYEALMVQEEDTEEESGIDKVNPDDHDEYQNDRYKQ